MKLNLNLVRIFYHVVEQQSFSKAGTVLFISQSAVSKGMKELESQLGLILINRQAVGAKKYNQIALTDDGQALFEYARAIFSLERIAVEDLQARQELREGMLSIGASSTIASYWLAEYVAKFHQRYPEIKLKVEVGNTECIKQAMIDCKIELALVEGDVTDPRISETVWQEESLSIIVPPNAEFSVLELQEQLWVVREEGSGTHDVVENKLQELGIVPKQRLTIASNEGVARMVACGVGVSILPTCIVQDLIKLNKLEVLVHPNAQKIVRPLHVLRLKDRPMTHLQQQFMEHLMGEPK